GIDAAIGRDDSRMFARADGYVLRIAALGNSGGVAAGGVGYRYTGTHDAAAAGEQQDQAQHCPGGSLLNPREQRLHGVAKTSICSGCVTSMRGPSWLSTQPRTRSNAPSSRSGSRPLSAN